MTILLLIFHNDFARDRISMPENNQAEARILEDLFAWRRRKAVLNARTLTIRPFLK
jgi:hypothetical protein